MSNIIGTIMNIEDFLEAKKTAISAKNGSETRELLTLHKNRKYIIPYFQREIRWEKENLIELMTDIKTGQKF